MAEPNEFPYYLQPPGPGERWSIEHQSGREIASFKNPAKAGMQLERLRLWWEHNRLVDPADIRAAVKQAILEAVDLIELAVLTRRVRS